MSGMRSFRSKFRLPIDHSFDGSVEKKHHHVIEIAVEYHGNDAEEDFKIINKAEQIIGDILNGYRNVFLNEMPEFENNTTIENVGEVLYKKIDPAFGEKDLKINRLEISENPLRVYAIVKEWNSFR